MELTIYASKKSYEKEGKQKSFYTYSTRILNKITEQEEFFNVKFREDCGAPLPANCPCNIIIEKKDANITEKERFYNDRETGEEKTVIDRVVWVSAWTEGSPFEDHSTDDYWT